MTDEANTPDGKTLTTRQGHPVSDNQNTRTIGDRGPATLENYQFLEKISHFDRERVPERVVHARGATAFGTFESYGTVGGEEPISTYTRAKLFEPAGKKTDVALRFSTVAGGRDSSEAVRDPRGFAVKFYTEDGNWDLVGNNLAVFFIRDAIKFPDFIHSQKPDPVTFERQVPNRVFDFISQTPEALHMISIVLSPRGVPVSYRNQQGFGVNTYRWVNAAGESKLVKYHWLPEQPVRSWTEADAGVKQGELLGVHTRDLYDAIERGDFPAWELAVQIIDDHDHPDLDFDPLDDTKVWPENDFPVRKIGRLELNRAPKNFFAESEQIAFGTGVLVDGLEFSDDKMLVGRTFSYSDTQRHRVGPNYLQLPVNQPKNGVPATNQRDGAMAYYVDETGSNPTVNYEPSIIGGLSEATKPATSQVGPVIEGRLTRAKLPRTNDYKQVGEFYTLIDQWEKDEMVANYIGNLSQCDRPIQERMIWHLLIVDTDLGTRVGEGIGITADDVRHLQPLATQVLNDEELARIANLGKNPPRDVTGLVMTHCVPNERDVVADEPEAASV
ncbi:MAG: catalase [Solirubrobacterales bacterium]|jgi:catalase|nr:catalase [Solirubrobacterales bacterium]